jgi:hypothetical protein
MLNGKVGAAMAIAAGVLYFGVVCSAATAMSVPNVKSLSGPQQVEKVVWCNRWRCGIGPGLLRPGAVGGVWHPWGYGAMPYRWCYYHPRQC